MNSIRRKCCCAGACCGRRITIAGWLPRTEYFGQFGGLWHYHEGTIDGTYDLDLVEAGPLPYAWVDPRELECHYAMEIPAAIRVGRYEGGPGSDLIDVPNVDQVDLFDLRLETWRDAEAMRCKVAVISQGSYVDVGTIEQIGLTFEESLACPLPRSRAWDVPTGSWPISLTSGAGIDDYVLASQVCPWGNWAGVLITLERGGA